MSSASFKQTKGIWKATKVPKGSNPYYLSSFVKTLNEIEPIFYKAKQQSEFDFIQALLSIRSSQSPGWDPYKTIKEVKSSFLNIQNKIRYEGDSTGYYTLFLYGLLLEASEYYERLGCLLEITEGKPFRVDTVTTFIDKNSKTKTRYPIDKINILKKLGKGAGFNITIFDDFFDNHLRNAIFHSDFVLYNGEVRTLNPDNIYSYQEILRLFNTAWGYTDAFDFIIDTYKRNYNKPKKVNIPTYFQKSKKKAQIIVRKGFGLVGIKAGYTKEEILKGAIEWRLARPFEYEQNMIDQGVVELPEDRFEKINKIIKKFPCKTRPFIVILINKNSLLKKWLDL